MKRTCEKAGILYGAKDPNGIIFHDIRRTVKTNMLRAGVDKVYRDLILGHNLKGMDVHYLAPSEDSLKEAMGKYARWLRVAGYELWVTMRVWVKGRDQVSGIRGQSATKIGG